MTNAHLAFKDLVWPAAAGNVAWSFVTLALNGPWVTTAPWSGRESDLWARLAALFLVAWYLTSEWLLLIDSRRVYAGERRGFVYWLGDGLLVLAIVLFAVALQMPAAWTELLYGLLTAAFVVAALWHLYDGWPEPSFHLWGLKVVLNLVGFAILWVGYAWLPSRSPWHMVWALFVVLLAWRLLGLDQTTPQAAAPPIVGEGTGQVPDPSVE